MTIELNRQLLSVRCNILMCQHFPEHIRCIHEQNTNLRMFLGCRLHYIACTVQARGVQGWGKCLHLHVWGAGISCKWECYIAFPQFVTPPDWHVTEKSRKSHQVSPHVGCGDTWTVHPVTTQLNQERLLVTGTGQEAAEDTSTNI